MTSSNSRNEKPDSSTTEILAGNSGGAWTTQTHQNFKASKFLNQGLAQFITRYIQPKNLMDFGGGVGLLANQIAKDSELTDSYIIEPEVVAPMAQERNIQLLNVDITCAPPPLVLDQKFDLVMSIEVAEHIDRSKHDVLFDFLAARAKRWVVFSGARPGQGGHGHIAERPETEWREEFVSRGFIFDVRMTALARTMSDRKNINHRRNIQVFRAPEDQVGLDELEARAKPHLAELLKIVQNKESRLEGNLFYVNLQEAIGGRPGYSLRRKRGNLMQVAATASSILELGFNAGHSALLFLLANSDSRIVCVDHMVHPYSQPCFDYLSATFGERISLLAGDSTAVLSVLPPQQFDLIHIDAGKHLTIAADLDAVRRLVKEDHVLVIDDTQNKALHDIVASRVVHGEIETSPFAVANERLLLSRWTHMLGRFVPQPDLVDVILTSVQNIYKEADHPSIYVKLGLAGQYHGRSPAAALVMAMRDVEGKGLCGAFVEVGVAAGHSSVIAALASSRFIPRDFYLFDTFCGYVELPDEKDHHGKSIRDYDLSNYAKPECGSGMVRERMRKTGVPEDRLFIIEGLAEERVAEYAPEKIAILRLDADLYAPTLASLETMFDRLEAGGWLIVDGYGHWQGCRDATDAFFAKRGETFPGVPTNDTCYVMQK